MDQPSLCSVRRLKYTKFVLQAKNAADEAMTGVCIPCCWMKWLLKIITMIGAMYTSSTANMNCEVLRHQVRICMMAGYTEELE